jgi:uncharacterized protein YdeI (YjbR/CyaY-like superfamily)
MFIFFKAMVGSEQNMILGAPSLYLKEGKHVAILYQYKHLFIITAETIGKDSEHTIEKLS